MNVFLLDTGYFSLTRLVVVIENIGPPKCVQYCGVVNEFKDVQSLLNMWLYCGRSLILTEPSTNQI